MWFMLLEYWIKYVLGMSAYPCLYHFLHVQHDLGVCVCVCVTLCFHFCIFIISFITWCCLQQFDKTSFKKTSVTKFLNSVTCSESLYSPWFLCHPNIDATPLSLMIYLLWLPRVQSSPSSLYISDFSGSNFFFNSSNIVDLDFTWLISSFQIHNDNTSLWLNHKSVYAVSI